MFGQKITPKNLGNLLTPAAASVDNYYGGSEEEGADGAASENLTTYDTKY